VKLNWDFFGIVTSIACAIHCALLPVVVTSLPMFGINIIHNTVFEWLMILIAFSVGCYAVLHGYYKHHRILLPFYIFSSGIIFLILKQLFPDLDILFLSLAVLLIVTGHYLNYKYTRRSTYYNSPHHRH
jgi:hypothetical protein